jgi:hypothetical protein
MRVPLLIIGGLVACLAVAGPALGQDRKGTRDADGFPSNPTRPHVDRHGAPVASRGAAAAVTAAEPLTLLLTGAGLLGAAVLHRKLGK